MVCQFIHMLCFITWIPEFKFCTLSPSKYLQHVTSQYSICEVSVLLKGRHNVPLVWALYESYEIRLHSEEEKFYEHSCSWTCLSTGTFVFYFLKKNAHTVPQSGVFRLFNVLVCSSVCYSLEGRTRLRKVMING